jgi:alkylation response protein AidB-like acyl-CoA dehydrogenase
LIALTQDQLALRGTTRRFAGEEVAPLVYEIDRDERFPIESWRRSAELGLLGVTAPEEHGGSGLGRTEMCQMGEELSAVCHSTAATVLHQPDMGGRVTTAATQIFGGYGYVLNHLGEHCMHDAKRFRIGDAPVVILHDLIGRELVK